MLVMIPRRSSVVGLPQADEETYDGLCDGLADGVDLGGVASSGDADADVDFAEAFGAED